MNNQLRYFLLVSGLLLLAMVQGCYYDIESELYPSTGNCDTTNITYTNTVAGVMSGSCTSCHSGAGASGGIVLDNYNDVVTHANSGKLMGSIKWANGYSQMPQGGSQLNQCTIDKLDAWINAGKPQ